MLFGTSFAARDPADPLPLQWGRARGRVGSDGVLMPEHVKGKVRDTTIVFLIVFSSFFVIGELGVRILRKEPPAMFVVSENQQLVYELNKNYKEINSFGMRDKEFDRNEINGLYKIAVIGDSHTFSIKVQNITATFPHYLEESLNQNIVKTSVKVINYGVPGYNTAQEL